jgi:hypothetical protein
LRAAFAYRGVNLSQPKEIPPIISIDDRHIGDMARSIRLKKSVMG